MREPDLCTRCTTHDCLRGNATQRALRVDDEILVTDQLSDPDLARDVEDQRRGARGEAEIGRGLRVGDEMVEGAAFGATIGRGAQVIAADKTEAFGAAAF